MNDGHRYNGGRKRNGCRENGPGKKEARKRKSRSQNRHGKATDAGRADAGKTLGAGRTDMEQEWSLPVTLPVTLDWNGHRMKGGKEKELTQSERTQEKN